MDDNISSFTQISVLLSKNDPSDLKPLVLFKGIYGVEENDSMMLFYFKGIETQIIKDFRQLLSEKSISFTEEIVEPTNWNQVWEDSFSPVSIGKNWYIRAEFHPSKSNFKHEIVISPKMAFGTGHHATTYMVLEQMDKLELDGKTVLDLGCGSGILAIAAEKLGAASVLAIDYDPLSVENTIENADLNNCSNITAKQADVYSFNEGKFDIILANINKKVLIDNILKIKGLLNETGILIISGILKSDEVDIKKIISKNMDFFSSTKDNWICIVLNNP